MLQTIFLAFMALCVGLGIMVLLVDGLFQDGFQGAIIGILEKCGLSAARANELYGRIFMQNKELLAAIGFIILFLIFFYFAMSKITGYLEEIGEEI